MTERSYEDVVKNIVEVMEQYVTPAVAQHGGEVNFVSFENGVVLVELSGACSGCAGSTMTLKHGIEQMMTSLIPEVNAVEGIDDPTSTVDPFYMSDPFGMQRINLEDYDIDLSEDD
jgi:Fe-S cluster biogenesis protein NfuA